MTLVENRKDLVDHASDFEKRSGFTYSILDGDEVIGCIYIYPSSATGEGARVRSWVTESRSDMDAVVWRSLSEWIETSWPFQNSLYATRS